MSTKQKSAGKVVNRPKKNPNTVVYHVDGKPVKLNLFDKMRIKLMSKHEQQAFLAAKLLEQERNERKARK